ncbi:hypothetical protein G3H63_05025 [Microbacterium resistens]|uniref:hypothetical protein n=1 Tax=Microbacterium resistens TaxID=156977 RepID=UPI001C56A590|nr:hypothetical protein [Microbacterium resistens]MBW1638444.1 hypothetical protein [Microbacterium resistens]
MTTPAPSAVPGPSAEAGRRAEPIPVAWPRVWGPAARGRSPFLVVGGAAMLGVSLAMLPGVTEAGMAALSPFAFALIGAAVLVLGLRRPFGRGEPEFVNAVVLTEAEQAPPDSWVHFLRQRRVGLPLLIMFWVLALVLVAAVPAAIFIALGGRDSALLTLVVTVPMAALFLVAAVRSTLAQHRLGSFGRRPVGLAVGPSGIALIRLGDPLYVPWDAISEITPRQIESSRSRTPPAPLIELRIDAAHTEGEMPGVLMLTPAGLRVHPWVVWGVLTHYRSRPEERAELGTTFGQRRLVAWNAWAGAQGRGRR